MPGNNNKALGGVTMKRCQELCLRETTFTCRSIDYNPSNTACHLSEEWSGSVPLSNPCYLSGWDYYELPQNEGYCIDTIS